MTATKKQRMMTEGSVLGGLIRTALPLILANILYQSFHVADTLMVGRWGGHTPEACAAELAAVGSTGALLTCIVSIFAGLSVATAVCVARELGANDESEVRKTVHTSVCLGLVGGLLAGLICGAFARPLLILMDTDAAVLEGAVSYMRAYAVGIPANILYTFFVSVLTARGEPILHTVCLTASGIVNVGLNAVAILVFGMGAVGVALATAISQWMALLVVFAFMIRRTDCCRLEWSRLRFDGRKLGELLSIGIPSGIQGGLFAVSNVFTQSAVNSFGEIMVAGNTAAANIETYLAVIQSGIGNAARVYLAQNFGAKSTGRVKRVLTVATALATGVALATSLSAYFGAEQILTLFAPENPEVVAMGMYRATMVLLPYFLFGAVNVGTSLLQGLGKKLLPAALLIGGCCVLRVLWVELLFRLFFATSPEVLYAVYPVSWAATALAMYIGVFAVYRQFKKQTELSAL